MGKIKVIVVDDSALVRSMLTAIIDAQPDMQCIGAASDPYVAREMIRNLNPDVLTLDVEMPRMDGLDFLEKLMRLRPMPVVMISTLTERGAEVTLRALELGAIDFVAKPKIGISKGLQEAGAEIAEKIRIASKAHIAKRPVAPPVTGPVLPSPSASAGALRAGAGSSIPAAGASASGSVSAPTAAPVVSDTISRLARLAGSGGTASVAGRGGLRTGTEKLIAIGASTGGTEAIREVLTRLPADFPAIVITQHMPPGFTRSFADRLNSICRISVSEAKHGERIVPGHAYIAPGGFHLLVERSGANYLTALSDAEPVNRHRPSVDVLFDSVAATAGPNAFGVILTGMGRDGADGMKRMRDAGAWNVAQDEHSCVVFGMPREAIAAGGVDEILPLTEIAPRLIDQLHRLGGSFNRV